MNIIGLDEKKVKKLTDELNGLLANYQIFYQNLRGYHWNIKGENFFELHVKFEEYYNDAQVKIDEIAERILTLGKTPFHSYSDYLENSEVKERKNESDGRKSIENLVESFSVLVKKERKILEMAADAGDEGTNALMSDYISEQEKTLWMLNAYLG